MPGIGIYSTAKVLGRTKIECKNDQWFIGDFCLVTVPELALGDGVQVNAGTKILGRERVAIGDRSVVSYDCLLLTSSDTPDPEKLVLNSAGEAVSRKHNDFSPEDERVIKSKSIVIGSDCFIGAKCVLMPGVVIPDKTVISAGSYVYVKTVDGADYLCTRPLGLPSWANSGKERRL